MKNGGLGLAKEQFFEVMPSRMSDNALLQNIFYFFSSSILMLRRN